MGYGLGRFSRISAIARKSVVALSAELLGVLAGEPVPCSCISSASVRATRLLSKPVLLLAQRVNLRFEVPAPAAHGLSFVLTRRLKCR